MNGYALHQSGFMHRFVIESDTPPQKHLRTFEQKHSLLFALAVTLSTHFRHGKHIAQHNARARVERIIISVAPSRLVASRDNSRGPLQTAVATSTRNGFVYTWCSTMLFFAHRHDAPNYKSKVSSIDWRGMWLEGWWGGGWVGFAARMFLRVRQVRHDGVKKMHSMHGGR